MDWRVTTSRACRSSLRTASGTFPATGSDEEGPEHEKWFRASVELGGERWGSGEGRTKKEAEQSAALSAVGNLRQQMRPATETR